MEETASTVLKPKNILFYDLETNGASHELDRILEVYAAKYNLTSREKEKEFHSLVKIDDNNVELFAFHKTGWTEEYLNTNGRPIQNVAIDFYKLLTEDNTTLLCGFYIRNFDNHFWRKYEKRYSLPRFPYDHRTFDCAIEYKAELAGLYERFPKDDWRKVHDMVLANNYKTLIKRSGYGLKTEDCCKYYHIPVNAKKQHQAKYDTELVIELLKKQRPGWL